MHSGAVDNLDPNTGAISGAPTAVGTSIVTISATNAGGTGSASLTITVNPPTLTQSPMISFSATSGTAVKGMTNLSVTVGIPAPAPFAVTAGVSLGAGSTAIAGQDIVIADAVVIPAGDTSATVPFTLIDSPTKSPNGKLANLVLTGISAGAQKVFALTVLDHNPLQATVDGTAVAGVDTIANVAQGSSEFIQVNDGVPPYQFIANGNNTYFTYFTGGLFGQFGVGADLNGSTGPSQKILLSVIGSGNGVLSISDATGATILINYTTSATVPTVSLEATAPALSGATASTYAALCPGTAQGLQRLEQSLAGLDIYQARLFMWESAAQLSVEWPDQPSGGLQPQDGMFLASRQPIALDFSGDVAPIFYTLTLRPGWNLVGVPPLSDGSNTYLSHPLSSFYLFDANGIGITGANRTSLIGNAVYAWDGTTYQQTTTMQSGVGYWIQNSTQPGQTLSLVRFLDVLPSGFTVPSGGLTKAAQNTDDGNYGVLVMGRDPGSLAPQVAGIMANGYGRRDLGNPPVPYGLATPSADPAPGGRCGMGSAGIVLAFLATFYVRRRRK